MLDEEKDTEQTQVKSRLSSIQGESADTPQIPPPQPSQIDISELGDTSITRSAATYKPKQN